MFLFVRSFVFLFLIAPVFAFAQLSAPEITSLTYPNQNQWYQSVEIAEFELFLPEDVVRIGLDISMDTPEAPERRLNDLYELVPLTPDEFENGVNYVNVQFFVDEAESDASEVGSYKVQIDDESPYGITAEFGEEAVYVTAQDNYSGVAMYEVLVEGVSLARIDGDSAGVNVLLKDVAEGASIEVRAFDAAGNTASETFTTEWAQVASTSSQPVSLEVLVALLTMISVSALLYAIAVRRSSRQREEDLKAEVFETKVQIKKIFIALRDEMADQIQALSARKKLTKREEEVLGSLTNALSVSETLIQKELSDFEGEKQEE